MPQSRSYESEANCEKVSTSPGGDPPHGGIHFFGFFFVFLEIVSSVNVV